MKFGGSVILENKSPSLLSGGIAHKVAAIDLDFVHKIISKRFIKDKHKIQKNSIL